MNNKFGRDDRYANERYRDPRDDRYREDRFGDERGFRSPDQEFETSGPYRQPAGDSWNQAPRYGRPEHGRIYDRPNGYATDRQGYGRPEADRQGYAPSPYVAPSYAVTSPYAATSPYLPRGFGGPYESRGGYAGRGPKGYTRTDDRIREDVCDRLSWHDEVDATEIAVRVNSGEVTLEGRVETRHMKRLAADLAEDVPGVTDVHNTIRVTKPILTELKEKITGEAHEQHYANTGTGTRTSGDGARNGVT